MASKNEDKWMANYEALKAHVAITGHFPDKHSTLNNWCRYQRKRIKAGTMPEEQMRLFQELADSRSNEHTGGRKKKNASPMEINTTTDIIESSLSAMELSHDNTQDKVKNDILDRLAYALTDHEVIGLCSQYIDLTDGTLIVLEDEYGWIEQIQDSSMLPQWQRENIKDYRERKTHDLVEIDPIPSYVSFRTMEDFADTCNPKQQTILLKALQKNRPFSRFRDAVERLNILQKWYDFKTAADRRMAEKWLYQNDLAIQDGKFVRCNTED